MVWANVEAKQLHLKIAYAGLPNAGAIDCARYVARQTHPDDRTEPRLTSDRGVECFYFMMSPSALGAMDGMTIYIHVLAFESPERHVMAAIEAVDASVDAVVLAADARPLTWLLQAQLAFAALRERMVALGRVWDRVPVVVQVNREDGGGAIADLRLTLAEERSVFEVTPSTGEGVFDALKQILKETLLACRAGDLVPFVPKTRGPGS